MLLVQKTVSREFLANKKINGDQMGMKVHKEMKATPDAANPTTQAPKKQRPVKMPTFSIHQPDQPEPLTQLVASKCD